MTKTPLPRRAWPSPLRVIAHDLHPDYFTTQWAAARGVATVAVQHHHAHVAAAMLEHRLLDREVLGVAWDGTGFGPDGTIWGGEFLLAAATGYRRMARLRPFSLPGREAAIREPWRVAIALLHDTREPAPQIGNRFAATRTRSVAALLANARLAPVTTSAGRLFDAVAALILPDEIFDSCSEFEGHAAMLLEAACDESAAGTYPFPLVAGEPAEIDWRPLISAILVDQRAGVAPSTIAMRFHRAAADAIFAVCDEHAQLPVVLGGGVFQNRVLVELLAARFAAFDAERRFTATALPVIATTTCRSAEVLPRWNGSPVLTTDSFVVSPLFFPGGDIGTLAVFGTVNDLAVAGARPLWLSLSLILEAGFSLEMLDRVLASVRAAADRAGVAVVTGDTKVVPHRAADGLFINTTGLGELIEPYPPGPAALQIGDELIVTGPIGRHGVAVLAARELLAIEPPPESDCAPLIEAVDALRCCAVPVRAMRDATRGGVAAVLHEWAAACEHSLVIEESRVPVSPDVRGVCELLGLDPLHVANEGTMLVAVPTGSGGVAVDALRSAAVSAHAVVIGHVVSRTIAPVAVKRILGREQPLDEPLGAPLPRIC